MLRKPTTITSEVTRAAAAAQAGDRHGATGRHRYGSWARNGGERIVENCRGPCPRLVNPGGF